MVGEPVEEEIEELVNMYDWQIEIPKVELIAPIKEGTTVETMNNFVGHFEMTSKTEGNIGVIAHNRGYPENYFADLKDLREGDKVVYKYYDFEKTYYVIKNDIIVDTDWSRLEESDINMITMITCVENEPELRRCVQAIEIIE